MHFVGPANRSCDELGEGVVFMCGGASHAGQSRVSRDGRPIVRQLEACAGVLLEVLEGSHVGPKHVSCCRTGFMGASHDRCVNGCLGGWESRDAGHILDDTVETRFPDWRRAR